MATITKFEDLEIWKLARIQAIEIYKLTQEGSFTRDLELRTQINRSSGSAMDNIAEGFDRFTNKEFSQFLVISKGSNAEVRSQLYRAYDRKHISAEILSARQIFSQMLGNKLQSFINYLKTSKYRSKPLKTKPEAILNTEIRKG